MSRQEEAITEFGRKGKIDKLTSLVSEFLTQLSNRSARNFGEKDVKPACLIILTQSDRFSVHDEYEVAQGYSVSFIQKSANSIAKYEALIEFKHLKKGETTAVKVKKS